MSERAGDEGQAGWPAPAAVRAVLAALGLYGGAVAALGRDVWGRLDTSIIGPGDFDNFYYAWSVWEFRRAVLAGRLPGYTRDVYGQAPSVPIFVEGFVDHLVALPLRLSCIEPAALWPCHELPNYPGARRFLADTLGRPLYAGARDGLTAWRVAAVPAAVGAGTGYSLGPGWIPYLGRLADGEPRRMMGAQARVVVVPAASGVARLRLRASSYARPMTLEVRFDGRLLAAAALPVGVPRDLDLGPVQLRPGPNELDLGSRQGCVVPNDLDPRYYGPDTDGVGYRCVSFAVERVALTG